MVERSPSPPPAVRAASVMGRMAPTGAPLELTLAVDLENDGPSPAAAVSPASPLLRRLPSGLGQPSPSPSPRRLGPTSQGRSPRPLRQSSLKPVRQKERPSSSPQQQRGDSRNSSVRPLSPSPFARLGPAAREPSPGPLLRRPISPSTGLLRLLSPATEQLMVASRAPYQQQQQWSCDTEEEEAEAAEFSFRVHTESSAGSFGADLPTPSSGRMVNDLSDPGSCASTIEMSSVSPACRRDCPTPTQLLRSHGRAARVTSARVADRRGRTQW